MENKIQIAINHLKVGNFHKPHIDMAIEALEKQLAIKPNYDERLNNHHCPKCNAKVNHAYCSNCGQKIDWDWS